MTPTTPNNNSGKNMWVQITAWAKPLIGLVGLLIIGAVGYGELLSEVRHNREAIIVLDAKVDALLSVTTTSNAIGLADRVALWRSINEKTHDRWTSAQHHEFARRLCEMNDLKNPPR